MEKQVWRDRLFDECGVKGIVGQEIDPMFCVRFGASVGKLQDGRPVAVGHSGSITAKILYHGILAGLCGIGAQVWDLGRITAAQMSFAAAYTNLFAGIYLSGEEICTIEVWDSDGLPSGKTMEQRLEDCFTSNNHLSVKSWNYRDIADMSGFKMLYQQALTEFAPIGLAGVQAMINCDDREEERLFRDVFMRLGGTLKNRPIFHVSASGMGVTAVDEKNRKHSAGHMLSLACLLLFEKGEDVAVPFDSPYAIDRLAKHYSRNCYRYTYITDETQYEIRNLSRKQYALRDGMMMTLMILHEMKRRRCQLWELVDKIPAFIECQTTYAARYCCRDAREQLLTLAPAMGNGVGWATDTQSVRIVPRKSPNRWLILAEAAQAEIADELCQQTKEKIADLLDR